MVRGYKKSIYALSFFCIIFSGAHANSSSPHVVLIDADAQCCAAYNAHQNVSRSLILSLAPKAIIHYKPFITDKNISLQLFKQLVRDIQKIPEPIVLFAGAFDADMSATMRAQLADIFRELCTHAWMVIAPAGNNNIWQRKAQLAYPAAYEGVISVGACGHNGKQAYIAPFSQYTPGKGPLFLLPGVQVKVGAMKQPVSGTSVSAALMAGFMAQIRILFGSSFTKQQVIDILRMSSVCSEEWNGHAVHGALNMTRALNLFQHIFY